MFDLRLVVLLPLAAALITGALVGVLVLTLAAWRGWPSMYAYIAAAGAALLSWLAWSARFVQLVEYKYTVSKLKAAPTHAAGPQTVNLHIHREDGAYPEGDFLDSLPVSDDSLSRLAGLVVAGQSLTTSAMSASGLDRSTWESLRDRFISAGLLAWRTGNRLHGCEVTSRGMVVFKRLASPTPPPREGRDD